MNTIILVGARIGSAFGRIFAFIRRRTVQTGRTNTWESTFVCSEAPLCAELLRRSHDNER